MPEPDLRTRIKEMLVNNLMLQTTADESAKTISNPTMIEPASGARVVTPHGGCYFRINDVGTIESGAG